MSTNKAQPVAIKRYASTKLKSVTPPRTYCAYSTHEPLKAVGMASPRADADDGLLIKSRGFV